VLVHQRRTRTLASCGGTSTNRPRGLYGYEIESQKKKFFFSITVRGNREKLGIDLDHLAVGRLLIRGDERFGKGLVRMEVGQTFGSGRVRTLVPLQEEVAPMLAPLERCHLGQGDLGLVLVDLTESADGRLEVSLRPHGNVRN